MYFFYSHCAGNAGSTDRASSVTEIDEFPAVCSLAVASGGSLFGHGRQHLADVRGQEVVHFVAQ